MIKQIKIASVATSMLLMASAATAATVTEGSGLLDDGWASQITYEDPADRGTSNDRDNGLNALGATDGAFFELGWGETVDLTFGTTFKTDISIVEVTFGTLPNATYDERVDVYLGDGIGLSFVGSYATTISNNSSQGPGGFTFNFAGGPWSVVRLIDTSADNGQTTGGFDLDSVRVQPVPLPAAGFLLLAGLGGLAAMRRRRKPAA